MQDDETGERGDAVDWHGCDRFPPEALSCDHFLGGRVTAMQPRRGFRSSTDAVFLAASVPARAGQSVLELGCGAGVASLCLHARVPGLRLTGVEIQPAYAALAKTNAERAAATMTVHRGDVTRLPAPVRAARFDHVMLNPPWYRAGARGSAADAGREVALAENVPLQIWLDAAQRRVMPGGTVTIINLAERLPEILGALDHRVGRIRILPLSARAGRPAGRVLVQATAGRRDALELLAPLVVHDGDRHRADADDFTAGASDVLRMGAATVLGTGM